MVGNASFYSAALRLNTRALSTLIFFAGATQAQVSISPLVIEVEANRGQAEGTISVSNNSNQPFRARVYAEPFTYTRDAGFQTLSSNRSDLTPYLQFSPRELVVPPGVTRRVRLITRFPPSLAQGEYRAVIFTENLNEAKDSSGNNVAIATRIGATIYVRQGNVSPNLVVDSASWNSQQKQIQLLVRNTGKASARPSVTWSLKQGETVVKTGKVDPAGVVAESDRFILLNYPTPDQPLPPDGKYQLTGQLSWGEDNKKTLPFNVNLTISAKSASVSGK